MTAPSGTPAPGALRRAIPRVSILLLAVAVFLPTLSGAFIGDDWLIVAGNPLVAGHDLRAIVASDYWGPGHVSGLYRPLTLLSLAANHALFGPEALSFHLVNLFLHAATALTLFLLAESLGLPTAGAWLAGALFAVHPVHLEAVVTVVGRAELLAALGGLLFLLLARSPGAPRRALGIAALGAALLAKESAVVFPALLLLFDLFGGEPVPALLRRRRGDYAAVLILVGAWALLRDGTVGIGVPLPPVDPYDNPLSTLAALPRVLTALRIQGIYLLRHLLPLDLQGAYGPSSVAPVAALASPAGIAAAGGTVGALLFAALLWRRRSPAVLGAALWAIGFSVTANLLFVHYVMMADRFAYLPSAGFCLAAGALAATPAAARLPRPARWATGAGWVAALALVTLAHGPDWRSPARLWERAVARDPGNGHAWVQLGDTRGKAGDFAGAEAAYRAGRGAAPGYRAAWEQLGYVLALQGRAGEALAVYRGALAALGRELPSARLGAARALLQLGRPAEALGELRRIAPADVGEAAWREVEEAARAQLRSAAGGG